MKTLLLATALAFIGTSALAMDSEIAVKDYTKTVIEGLNTVNSN